MPLANGAGSDQGAQIGKYGPACGQAQSRLDRPEYAMRLATPRRSPAATNAETASVAGGCWPIDRRSLAALLDLGLTVGQIARYFSVDVAEVRRLRAHGPACAKAAAARRSDA